MRPQRSPPSFPPLSSPARPAAPPWRREERGCRGDGAGRRGREGSGGRHREGRGGVGRAAAEQRGEAGRPSVQGCDQDRAKARPHSTRRRFPPSSPALTRSAALPGSVQPARGAPQPRPPPLARRRSDGRRAARVAAQHGGAAGVPRSRPCPAEPPSAPPPPGGRTELEAWRKIPQEEFLYRSRFNKTTTNRLL